MGNACTSLKQTLPVEPLGARQQTEQQQQQTRAEQSQAQSHHSYQPETLQISPLLAPADPPGTQPLPQFDQTIAPEPVFQQPAGHQQQQPAETPDRAPGVPAQQSAAAVAASHQHIAEPEPAAAVSAEQPATGSYAGQQPASAEQTHLEPVTHQGGKSMEAAAKENVPPHAGPSLVHETPLSSPPLNYRARRRASVSAEVASLAASVQVPAIKPRQSFDTEQVLVRAMKHSFLFSDLEEEQKIDCISSMFKKDVNANEVVIRQGEEGDNFYVIAEGVFTARIAQADGGERVVFTYNGKGAFGELALMYNCPRAATVRAETPGLLWGMDRLTFRRIILASRIAQRERFEEVLRNMSVFSSLSPGQKASIADCLVLEVFEEGTHILKEGEELTPESKFYIVESGTVTCFRTIEGQAKLVKEIGKGGFFGEVALITKSATRAADCVALTRCKLLAMGRDAFERLMGPAEEILKKEVDEYARLNSDLARQAGSASSADAATASEQPRQGKSADQGAGKAAKKASLAKPPSKKAGPDGPRYSLV